MNNKELHWLHLELLEIGTRLRKTVAAVEDEIRHRERLTLTTANANVVLEAVGKAFGVSPETFCRKTAKREVLIVRQTAQYLLREIHQFSYPTIAQFTGIKDHTTIMNSLSRVRLKRELNPEFDAKIRALWAEILREQSDEHEECPALPVSRAPGALLGSGVGHRGIAS